MYGAYLSKTEERLRALVERGWRPQVNTHLMGRRAVEKWDLPGPWVEHSPRWLIGWYIFMRPGEELSKRGATGANGGVYATLDQCLDWAELHADREQERTG